ncbi:MAG: elongation factor P [Chlamydiae bacterium GWC2_50_10]|nr:MAG: elongation factor P [Chlamydiae bacterium GWC2_50_10]OGN57967.1 MAG: elongation factor P [Chlamydiae bacterium RIFCSPHIGHO2_02_FULL_49_29]OGN64408.1 MAG: elongation factor P [Chlamydiae bacterium RIFCSPHIGHO2_12_FULL_49_32]OGN68054.1 MAG: elongation factor P [Chlamydiae bacterium RIFCSPLOWO2_02_FULL_49_12]OGN70946.1 MAG: elongation factor P [Chlamydiae bacterium RIFCSPLOWO2_12_FULL_49_12]HCJ84898.1 elongation factor P [Parachlamydiales bacterium]
MVQVSTNEFKIGMKVEIDRDPYLIVGNDFVKPGKGQPFNRTKLKHLISGRVIERTFKSGERIDLADIEESKMRLLYREPESVVFMNDVTFDQLTVPKSLLANKEQWLMEETLYSIIFYKGQPISVEPPTFLEMNIVETTPGLRGDSSGRVLKPAKTETGAIVQVPLFIEEGEKIKVDTRDGSYVGRV